MLLFTVLELTAASIKCYVNIVADRPPGINLRRLYCILVGIQSAIKELTRLRHPVSFVSRVIEFYIITASKSSIVNLGNLCWQINFFQVHAAIESKITNRLYAARNHHLGYPCFVKNTKINLIHLARKSEFSCQAAARFKSIVSNIFQAGW